LSLIKSGWQTDFYCYWHRGFCSSAPIVLVEGGGKEAGLGLCKLSGLLEATESWSSLSPSTGKHVVFAASHERSSDSSWLHEGLKIQGIKRSTGQVGAGRRIWKRRVQGVRASEGQARITGNDCRSDRLLEPEVPERCPNCGYRPVTIEVAEIEDRHSKRGHRPE